jgi:hypothetical protein
MWRSWADLGVRITGLADKHGVRRVCLVEALSDLLGCPAEPSFFASSTARVHLLFSRSSSPAFWVEPSQSTIAFRLWVSVDHARCSADSQCLPKVLHVLPAVDPPKLSACIFSIAFMEEAGSSYHEHSSPPKFLMTASPPGCSFAQRV